MKRWNDELHITYCLNFLTCQAAPSQKETSRFILQPSISSGVFVGSFGEGVMCIASMYSIFTYIYHKNQQNLG